MQSSIIDHFPPQTATRETNTEHNMAAEEQREMEGSHAILQEIKRGNEVLLQKLDAKTAEIHHSISGLKTVVDGMCSRITEAEERISTAEDKLTELDSHVLRLMKEKDFLVDKIDQLENQSRRNNVRIVNLQEGEEGSDPVRFFTDWIPSVLGQQHFPEPLVIERAHRSPTSRTPRDTRPRPILIRLLKYQDRDKILRMAAKTSREKGGPVTFKGEAVMFFPDLSANLVKRRKEYNQVKKELHAKKLQFSLLHPATLRVTLSNGEKKFFKSPEAAASFLRDVQGGD